mgnify:CR=1 FL=1
MFLNCLKLIITLLAREIKIAVKMPPFGFRLLLAENGVGTNYEKRERIKPGNGNPGKQGRA